MRLAGGMGPAQSFPGGVLGGLPSLRKLPELGFWRFGVLTLWLFGSLQGTTDGEMPKSRVLEGCEGMLLEGRSDWCIDGEVTLVLLSPLP